MFPTLFYDIMFVGLVMATGFNTSVLLSVWRERNAYAKPSPVPTDVPLVYPGTRSTFHTFQ